MKNIKKIRTKMLIYILSITLLVYILVVGYMSIRFQKMLQDDARKIADLYVNENALKVEVLLNKDYGVAKTMADFYQNYKTIKSDSLDKINLQMLYSVLDRNEHYIATFLQWELYAVDESHNKPFGRKRISLFRENFHLEQTSNIIRLKSEMLDLDGDDSTGLYFKVKNKKKPIITEPYFYTYALPNETPSDFPTDVSSIIESTIIVPIIDNNNEFLGLTGMDIPLNKFQQLIGTVKPFDECDVFLVSNQGNFLAHSSLKVVTDQLTNIQSYYFNGDVLDKIKNGSYYSFDKVLDDQRGKNYISLAPIFIGDTETPWSLGISVPYHVIWKESNQNLIFSIGIAALGIFILIILISFISINISKPITEVSELLAKFAKGDVHQKNKFKKTSKDEIGIMQKSANQMIEALNSTAQFALDIGNGKLDTQYTPLSKKDILGHSILEMRNKLKQSKINLEKYASELEFKNKELEKLSIVASKTDNAIAIMNNKGDIEWINNGLTKLYGYTKEEFIDRFGKNITQGSSNKQIKDLIKNCVKNKLSAQYYSKNITKNGETIWSHTTISPVFDQNNKLKWLVAIDSDITKLKNAEMEISQQKAEILAQRDSLRELNITKDKFFRIIAHDLKNPFTALLSISQSLSEDFYELKDSEKHDYIKRVYKSSERLYALLDNLLNWATAEAGIMKFKKSSFDLKEILDNNLMLHKENARNKNLKLITNLRDKLIINADKDMISTVLRNLISNAIKFSHKNSKIDIFVNKLNNNIQVEVKDYGVGIEPDKVKKIFSFQQSAKTLGTFNEKGTGLGLVLCKEFIELHKGKIWIESEINKGSSFIFKIPY